MKKIVSCIACAVFSASVMGAQELIMRIDDMGAFHSVNKACVDAYRNGIAKSVEVLCVGAWFPEAVKMLRENPGLDAGVHLAITSEWENVKWRPLTDCPSLVDDDGYFLPMMWPNPAYPGQSVLEKAESINMAELEAEFRAQIELAMKHIPQLSHISGHMFSTMFNKEVNELTKRLAKEYGLICTDVMEGMQNYSLEMTGYSGESKTSEDKTRSFIKSLEGMEKGKRYYFIDHPAYNDSEMQTVFHIGYENVAVDRQGVTDFMTHPDVKAVIEKRRIKLMSIAELGK
ncbi:MAG: polysaccharide deacetylase family protein [Candidatus Cryptobacteroides sp.]